MSTKYPAAVLPRTRGSLGFVLLAAATLLGCGSDGEAASSHGQAANYALASVVSNVDGDTTYISLISSLDAVDVDFRNALEVPGTASVAAYGGWLFVGGGESPTILAIRSPPRAAS